MKAEGGREV